MTVQASLPPMAKSILHFTHYFESSSSYIHQRISNSGGGGGGGETWDYRSVAIVFLILFLSLQMCVGTLKGKKFIWKGGVEWHALLHCIITGIGSLLCLYLDIFYAEAIGGTPGKTISPVSVRVAI